MEFATDFMTSLRDRFSPGGDTAVSGAIDWFSLQTRFAAAHAARRELGRIESVSGHSLGGFAEWAAGQGASDRASPNINPIDLADRKGPAGMDSAVAEQAYGGRG